MPVSVRNRWLVFAIDEFTCIYCGRSAPDVQLHADHLWPRARGGKDILENLVTSCASCNLSKNDIAITEEQIKVLQQKRQKRIDKFMALNVKRPRIVIGREYMNYELPEFDPEFRKIDESFSKYLYTFWKAYRSDSSITLLHIEMIWFWFNNTIAPKKCIYLLIADFFRENNVDENTDQSRMLSSPSFIENLIRKIKMGQQYVVEKSRQQNRYYQKNQNW